MGTYLFFDKTVDMAICKSIENRHILVRYPYSKKRYVALIKKVLQDKCVSEPIL